MNSCLKQLPNNLQYVKLMLTIPFTIISLFKLESELKTKQQQNA